MHGRRYFLTGDIGHLDEDGYVVITDRKKDLILVGGFNVYPKDVEEVLYTHPKVAQAAVIGLPDPQSGERVKAFIQLRPGVEATVEELAAFCQENMAGYKRPREFEFRESLPTSVVGKILRRVLREQDGGTEERGDGGTGGRRDGGTGGRSDGGTAGRGKRIKVEGGRARKGLQFRALITIN